MTIAQWNNLKIKAEHSKPTKHFTRENFAGEIDEIKIFEIDNYQLTFVNDYLGEVKEKETGRTVKKEELTRQNYESQSTENLKIILADLQKEVARRERLETEELIKEFESALNRLKNRNVSIKITGIDETTAKAVDGTFRLDHLTMKAFL